MPPGSLPATAGAAYQFVRQQLSQANIAAADLDAALLTEWATGLNRLEIMARPETALTDSQSRSLVGGLDARLAGKPVHRLVGRRDFFGMPFELSDETLEPRPDTECVVELALRSLGGRLSERLFILDLGAGTGIIAVSLLSRLPNAQALAVDLSEKALATTQRNAEINGVVPRLRTLKSDWLEKVEGRFDLIISNPPYIKSPDIAALSREVREHDPMLALDGGVDGLAAYRLISVQALGHLHANGYLALEIGHDQRESVAGICVKAGFKLLEVARDLGGNDRALLFSL